MENENVAAVEAKLPAFTVEIPNGYPRGTYLQMNVEFRVRGVRYEENRKGELVHQLILAVEDIELTKVLSPSEEVTSLGVIQDFEHESEVIEGQVTLEEALEAEVIPMGEGSRAVWSESLEGVGF